MVDSNSKISFEKWLMTIASSLSVAAVVGGIGMYVRMQNLDQRLDTVISNQAIYLSAQDKRDLAQDGRMTWITERLDPVRDKQRDVLNYIESQKQVESMRHSAVEERFKSIEVRLRAHIDKEIGDGRQ